MGVGSSEDHGLTSSAVMDISLGQEREVELLTMLLEVLPDGVYLKVVVYACFKLVQLTYSCWAAIIEQAVLLTMAAYWDVSCVCTVAL